MAFKSIECFEIETDKSVNAVKINNYRFIDKDV